MIGRLRAPTGATRVALDVATQFFPFAVNVLDRLVLTALALRVLGVEGFAYWSVAMSLTALLSFLDFGCLMNFSNMVVHAKERGDIARSVRIYQRANTIFLIIGSTAALAGLVIALSPGLQNFLGFDPHGFAVEAPFVLAFLAVATGAKLATSNAMAVYRANLKFGRGSVITAIVDLLRIIGTIVGLLIGHGLIGAAIGHAAGTCIGVLLMMTDITRTLPDYHYRFRSPRSEEMRGVLRASLAFAAPFVPIAIMNQGPVLLLNGHATTGADGVAMFVLLRTLSNIIRTLVLKVTNVLGMEVARLDVRGEQRVARRLMDLIGWQLAVAFGYVAGILLAGGAIFVRVWTGKDHLFDMTVLAIMLAPMVLTPTYLISAAFLQYRNTPRVWTIGMFAQLAVGALVYFALPGQNQLVRVSAGIFVGELLGVAAPVVFAADAPLRPGIVVRELARGGVATLMTIGTMAMSGWLIVRIGGHGLTALAIAAVILAVPCAALAALPLPSMRRLLKERRQ